MGKRRHTGVTAKAVAGPRYRYSRRVDVLEDWDEAADETLKRFLVDWCEFWRDCGYGLCFRAGRCRRRGVPCFARDLTKTSRVLFGSPAFVELYDAAVEVADGFGDEEE
jgi:hypothetical protein